MKEILSSISGIFQTQESKLMRHERVALSNIILVAKERLWLADSFDAIEYDTEEFSEEISIDSINNIKQSIKVAESYLEKHNPE